VQRLQNLINTTLSAHDKMTIEAFEKLVVHLPAKGYGTTEFDMPDEKRNLLVDAGRVAMKAYFEEAAGRDMVSFGMKEEHDVGWAQSHADRLALKMLKR